MTTKNDPLTTALVEASAAPAARKEAAGIVKRSSAFFADPKMIAPKVDLDTGKRFNHRIDFGDIEGLAVSIKANGVLNPLRVKRIAALETGEVFELIDGERRLTALKLILKKDPDFLAEEGVPIVIVDKAQSDLTSKIQMFEANNSKNFTPIEEAMAYKDFRDAGMSVKQICAAVGRAHMHVTEILALLDGDQSLIEAAASGTIGKTMAKTIARQAKGDKGKQAELVKAAAAAGKDKGALRVVKKAIDESRRTKAAKKGRTLKIRALSDVELSDLGAKLAATMTDKMKDAGKPLNFNLREWVGKDEALALAASFGALEALKAAAGAKTSLEF